MVKEEAVRQAWRSTRVALRFLTRLPLPPVEVVPGDLRRAQALFPAVGLVVAALGIAVRVAAQPWWGATAATVAAVLAMVVITGGLHEDGLADAADGLWGGWEPSQRLEIMRDSRVGTYGIVAVTGALGLRVALLAPLGPAGFARAVVAGHILGRAAMLVLAHRLPAATPGSGSGSQVVGGLSRAAALTAGLTVVLTVGVAAGPWSPVPVLAASVAVAGCARLFRRRLGGVTGDTLGAANQVVEVVALAAMSALVQAGLV